ncbi:MAG TPA: hotdog fold domain-containing protein [Acidimicrobiales bacterium]|nr:hotdog fold domain-containing protein [Acidimicrobiales bacterium]
MTPDSPARTPAPGPHQPSAHPAIAGREGPMAELADTVRHLTELTVTNAAGPAVLGEVTARLQEAAALLAAHVPDEAHPRFVDGGDPAPEGVPPDGDGEGGALDATAGTRSMERSMPYDPVIGRFNPLALPVRVWFEPPMALASACFTTPYEGGPGWVHGAAIAATFDIVLTAANHLAQSAGPTVWLTVRFRRPTLVGVEARFEAEVVDNDGRRVRSTGRLIQDGLVCVEAEGEFAVLDPARIRSVAEGNLRRRRRGRAGDAPA